MFLLLKEQAVIHIWEEFSYWYFTVEYQNVPSPVWNIQFAKIFCIIYKALHVLGTATKEFTIVHVALQQLH